MRRTRRHESERFRRPGRIARIGLGVLGVIAGARAASADVAVVKLAELERFEHSRGAILDWSAGLAVERGGWSAAVLDVVREEELAAGRTCERGVELAFQRSMGSHLALGLSWGFDLEEGVGSAGLTLGLGLDVPF